MVFDKNYPIGQKSSAKLGFVVFWNWLLDPVGKLLVIKNEKTQLGIILFDFYRCVAVGVNIYVDAVMNHMSGNDRTGNYI